LPVHVLIRPRAGSFCYSEEERELIVSDVRHALAAGAAGVVVGAIRDDGIDTDLVARVRDLSRGAEVTFHRAFDTLADRVGALDVLAGLGVDRVLTSGGASLAPDACDELVRLVAAANGRVQVMAGSGIDARSVRRVLATGVDAVHASAKRVVPDALSVGLGSLSPAGAGGREATDPGVVRALRQAITDTAAR
jgi:copper homeostasis protein